LALGVLVVSGMVAHTAAAEPKAPTVIVAEAAAQAFPLTVEALGTAHANESIEIRPQIYEVVTAIHFEEGQTVEAGQVLVELDATEASAAVAAARAELVDSDGQFRRAEELYKTKAVAASELEQRAARRDADSAQLDVAKARLSDSVLRAPFAGRVGLRRVSVGGLVNRETVITTLDDTDLIKLDFDVPETAFPLLAKGLPVEARSAAWPGERFEGRVRAVDTRVDPVSRSVTVRAVVPNADHRLLPGMFLSVRLERVDVVAVMVPEESIVPEQSRQYVFVVAADDRVEKRQVRTGRRRPGQVEVLEGVVAGERVVSEGTQKVRAGERVSVVGSVDAGAGSAP
jgi:membrane fusion protein (multidrug efflux system)